MQIVRCDRCGWIGDEKHLTRKRDKHGETEEFCPSCKANDSLLDVELGCSFSEQEIEELWNLFKKIPISGDGTILEEFLGFANGVSQEEVWRWFDEEYSGGICRLMGI